MALPAAAATSRPLAHSAYDRTFYSGVAILMAITTFIGFAPTFYLRSAFGAPVSPTGMVTITPLVIAHGVIFTAWVILFIVQTRLIASRNVALHRRLGVGGVVLGVAMIAVGVPTATIAAARGSAPPGMEPLVFLVVPFADLVLFAGFLGAAVLRRRDKELHKRLMLMAYCAIIPAAIGRLPGGVIALGPPAIFGLAFLPAVAGAIYDKWSRGRVTPIYWWGIAILYLSIPGRIGLAMTPMWRTFAGWAAS
jgi:hypothetical protein